jgi:hypothetical protein
MVVTTKFFKAKERYTKYVYDRYYNQLFLKKEDISQIGKLFL